MKLYLMEAIVREGLIEAIGKNGGNWLHVHNDNTEGFMSGRQKRVSSCVVVGGGVAGGRWSNCSEIKQSQPFSGHRKKVTERGGKERGKVLSRCAKKIKRTKERYNSLETTKVPLFVGGENSP